MPPIVRRRPGGSPGQLIVIVLLVVIALYAFAGNGAPAALADAALRLAILFPALIISLSFHEFAHAWVADRLGDSTARNMGRLTLDPRAHLDPLGTFVLILTVILRFGIGWAKPVPVNPWRLRTGPRTGMAIVAVARPIANLLLALVAIRVAKLLTGESVPDEAIDLLALFAQLNVTL